MARILLVDDDEVLSKLYRNKLTAEGHDVSYASDGKSAERALVHSYDLIVLDIMMPQTDGLSLLQRAKKGKQKDTPVLIYTNLIDEKVKKNALALGARAVLLKADRSF